MVQQFGLTFIALFVALDCVGNLPMLISLTRGLSRPAQVAVVNTSMWVALAVALIFLFIGEGVFHYLGITLFDFQVAGGLVLLLISLAELLGGPEATHQNVGSTGIVPLAVPLITGPAIITSLVLQVNTAGYGITITALFANYLLAWIVFRNSERVTRLIGKDGTVIVSKVAALFLAAIAVSMIRSGIFSIIKSTIKLNS